MRGTILLVNPQVADRFWTAMNASQSGGRITGTFTLAALVALLFASMLSVAPRWHERIHTIHANHECAVTLIASGKYDHSEAPALIAAPQSLVEFSSIPALHPVWVATPFLSASIFEHAPPALS